MEKETPENEEEPELKAEDVLEALDELDEEEFEKFKFFLQHDDRLSGKLKIKRKQLERAPSFKIVDLMLQTYTKQLCLEVTTNILEKIQRNDLRQKFAHSKSLDDARNAWKKSSRNEAKQRKTNDVNQIIKIRENKIQEMKALLKISKDAADREKAEGVLNFMALKESAERRLKELIKEIEDKEKSTENEVEEFIKDLEQEISDLKTRSSKSDFHRSASSPDGSPNKNWVEDRVHPPSYDGTVERAVAQLKETLWEDMKKQLEMKKVQQYEVDLTLDPKTAHPKLILSDDKKQVKHGNVWQNLPENPERFTVYTNVLAEQSFSSGRFYFEVQVKGKTDWDLGVVRESIERQDDVSLSTENGFWTFMLRNGNYSTGDNILVRYPLHPGPEKVGVFVDYGERLVSFYNVDAAALICSFTDCQFTEKIYPFFSPFLNNGGSNSSPLIICPVNDG